MLAFISLYLAVFLLMSGAGLLGTCLSLQLTVAGEPAQVVGYVMSAYYFGMFIGAFYCHRLIKSVGHIRSFAAFAAVTTAIALLHGLYMSPLFWGILRFFTGVCLIGLFTTIESWLNECADPQNRGKAMSVYMVMNFLGMGAGQQLLNLVDVQDLRIFFVVGLTMALSLVPVVVTHSIHPELPHFEPFKVWRLFRKAPIGMLGCLASGLINGAFYSIGPVFCHKIGLSVPELSLVMTVTIIGGLVLQWPIGTISDRFDRTFVLSFIGLTITALSLLIMFTAERSTVTLMTLMLFFGGLIFAIYPLSVARAHDLFDQKDIVPVSSVLLLFFGTGAMTGPIVASSVMTLMKTANVFFAYFASVAFLYTLTAFYLRKKELVQIVPVNENVPFVVTKDTSPVAPLIDPRVE